MKFKIILLAIFTIALFVIRPATDDLQAASDIYRDSLTFTAVDFQFEANVYTSPPIQSPIPFNALFPSWTVTGEEESMRVYVHTSKTGQNWSEWRHIAINHDWTLPDDPDLVGDIVLVPISDQTHQWIQYRLEKSKADSQIDSLLFTFIDSTAGPTAEELVAQQAALDKTKEANLTYGYPKPDVVSRDVWCQHPDCNYTEGLAYSPTTHLIIHHTASANHPLDYDWPAVVRAVWEFHTHGRNWGDIGYNYLVDPNGVLYEGHLGGDDVIGTHAGNANAGSMALSFMGNFSTAIPYNAMVDSAIELFAWKADQQNINVFDASLMPALGWGLPNLMGHRDVYGGTNTQCPGERLHELIPYIQEEVASAIGFVDPAIYINEMSSAFRMSNPNVYWYDSARGCGHLRHGYYTYSVLHQNESTNWGEWQLDVPTNGRYQLDAYVPFCTTETSETNGAVYDIDHVHGHSTVTVSQNDKAGLWISLGQYDLPASGGGVVRLTDLTSTDEELSIWFDSLRLTRVQDGQFDVTAVNTTPANNGWTNTRTITFEWALTHPESINNTILQVATDARFKNIIITKELPTNTPRHTLTLPQDYAPIYWRVYLNLNNGGQITSTATLLNVDSTPPISHIPSLYQLKNGDYIVNAQGTDAFAGIAYYNLDYRQAGSTTWTSLAKNVTGSVRFSPPNGAAAYEFRSQAIDLLGNTESLHASPDATSNNAILLDNETFLPIVIRS